MSDAKTPKSLRAERIAASPRYIDGAFRNPSGATPRLEAGTMFPVMRDFVFRRGQRRPAGGLPTVDPTAQLSRPSQTGLRVTWLGHSTLLIEIDGIRLLTDPVWRERASPVPFAGPKRFQPMPVPISGLGEIDAVLLSHDHFDHLDRDAVLALAAAGVPFVASLGVGNHLEAWGVDPASITELDWWESTEVARRGAAVSITAGPAQHFSGRGLTDRNQTLWSSFAIRGPRRSFFFSGDTGLIDEYSEIGERLGKFDIVALEVGAHHPAWGSIHLGPDNAVIAHQRIGSGALLPIHWGTFDLALHDWFEPIETLSRVAESTSLNLLTPRIGEPFEALHREAFTSWWRDSMHLK